MTLDPSWSRPRDYAIREGRVETHSLEVHVVDHCNLRCASCCVLSPIAPKRFLRPSELARDLDWARRVLAPSVFKLAGGEPLLSPHVVELATLARASRIAPQISLTTNGVLAHRAPDALFEVLDAMTVSIYPDGGLDDDALARLRERAHRFRVTLNEKRQTHFERMTRDAPEANTAATRAVFDGCWLRHRCHTLRDGMLTTCSRVPALERLAGSLAGDRVSLAPRDGLARDLQQYLERSEPLSVCARCSGSTSALLPFRQLTRRDVRERRYE